MNRHCLTLDLKDDERLIAAYEQWHRQVWPEVRQSIRAAGITGMDIYRYGNRLFMVMETDDAFSFERKTALDANNPKVQAWEQLMWQYQQPLPGAPEGAKWMPMHQIFSLDAYD